MISAPWGKMENPFFVTQCDTISVLGCLHFILFHPVQSKNKIFVGEGNKFSPKRVSGVFGFPNGIVIHVKNASESDHVCSLNVDIVYTRFLILSIGKIKSVRILCMYSMLVPF